MKVGINIQPGQTLIIRTPLFAADFVRLVAKKAYEAGAKHVRPNGVMKSLPERNLSSLRTKLFMNSQNGKQKACTGSR